MCLHQVPVQLVKKLTKMKNLKSDETQVHNKSPNGNLLSSWNVVSGNNHNDLIEKKTPVYEANKTARANSQFLTSSSGFKTSRENEMTRRFQISSLQSLNNSSNVKNENHSDVSLASNKSHEHLIETTGKNFLNCV